MTLQEHCKKDKLTIIAMHALLCDCAEDGSIVLDGSLSRICRQAEVNRTQLYERKAQLREALSRVELAGPGRPANSGAAPVAVEEHAGQALREQVLRYRLAHPGAVVSHVGGGTNYSDGFRRFILDLADTREGTLESFCQWAEIPCPTLMSWQRRDRATPMRRNRCGPWRSCLAPPPRSAEPWWRTTLAGTGTCGSF